MASSWLHLGSLLGAQNWPKSGAQRAPGGLKTTPTTQEAPRGFQDAKNDPPSGQNDAPSGQNDPPSGQNDPPSGQIDLQKRPPNNTQHNTEHNTTHNTEHNTTQQHRTQDNTAHLDSTRQGGGATLLGPLGAVLGAVRLVLIACTHIYTCMHTHLHACTHIYTRMHAHLHARKAPQRESK